MAPQLYRADRRKEAAAETRRRIVDAVAKLHAEHGVTRTTYAMVATHANVAIPTVYNHFPTESDLLAACTSHVAAGAPPLGPQIFAGADGLEDRVNALVRALCAYYRYYAPWLRWAVHEAVLVRQIADLLARASDGRRQLILMAFQPAFGPRPPELLVALCGILLDFPAWQRLAHDEGISADAVEKTLGEALLALAREHLSAMGRAPAAGRAIARRRRPT